MRVDERKGIGERKGSGLYISDTSFGISLELLMLKISHRRAFHPTHPGTFSKPKIAESKALGMRDQPMR